MTQHEKDLKLLRILYERIEELGYQPNLTDLAKSAGIKTQTAEAAFRRLVEVGFVEDCGVGSAFKLNAVCIKIFHESHRGQVEEFWGSLQ